MARREDVGVTDWSGALLGNLGFWLFVLTMIQLFGLMWATLNIQSLYMGFTQRPRTPYTTSSDRLFAEWPEEEHMEMPGEMDMEMPEEEREEPAPDEEHDEHGLLPLSHQGHADSMTWISGGLPVVALWGYVGK
ncbi:MAG: hypothetical protein GWN58_21065 [Anaerolineae bacterium]|nr:hypothetical protein [Anaerolineae bacterium]